MLTEPLPAKPGSLGTAVEADLTQELGLQLRTRPAEPWPSKSSCCRGRGCKAVSTHRPPPIRLQTNNRDH